MVKKRRRRRRKSLRMNDEEEEKGRDSSLGEIDFGVLSGPAIEILR